MNHDSYPDSYIRSILEDYRVYAVVGASAKPTRPSYFVAKYLLARGYDVIPVNPGLVGSLIAGQTVAGSLLDIERPVDVVDVFRNSNAALSVAEEAIRIGAKVVWMQLGVRNEEAARLAEDAGLKVVMNRCPKIEYGRLSGEIGWAGVNSGVVSSKRSVRGTRGIQQRALRNGS